MLYAFGHTMGGTPRVAKRGPREQALFDAMRGFRFEVMGSNRSHWEFYQGFSLVIGLNLAILAVLMWQLSNLSRTEPRQARPIVTTLVVSEALLAALSQAYFFLPPALFSIVITLCLAMAVFAMSPGAKPMLATAPQTKAG